jgi:hypothetical protein
MPARAGRAAGAVGPRGRREEAEESGFEVEVVSGPGPVVAEEGFCGIEGWTPSIESQWAGGGACS